MTMVEVLTLSVVDKDSKIMLSYLQANRVSFWNHKLIPFYIKTENKDMYKSEFTV